MTEHPDMRVSDAERDEVVELLREHRMVGRLDAEEHEERVAEACAARYARDLEHALRELPSPEPPAAVVAAPPVFVQARPESGGAAVGFGVAAMLVLLFSGGLAAVLALPLAGTGWALAAQSESRRGLGLGMTMTALSVLSMLLWTLGFVGLFFG